MEIDFPRSGLLIIDLQNDFCPGGALAVEKGDEVAAPLNRLSSLFAARSGRVVATQDWHPPSHVSFAASHRDKNPGDKVDIPGTPGQILWPVHGVQGSRGADFYEGLDLRPVQLIIRKGFHPGLDSYSAFFENDRKTSTGLDGFLKALGVEAVYLGGLATDYCVLYSALDAVRLGYKTTVVSDAVRGVDFPEGSVERAFKLLSEAGVHLSASEDIA
jgi:nicotinamidase/pyrazinamidase